MNANFRYVEANVKEALPKVDSWLQSDFQIISSLRRMRPAAGHTRDHEPSKAHRIVVSIALICTTSRRIPVSASSDKGTEKDDLVPL